MLKKPAIEVLRIIIFPVYVQRIRRVAQAAARPSQEETKQNTTATTVDTATSDQTESSYHTPLPAHSPTLLPLYDAPLPLLILLRLDDFDTKGTGTNASATSQARARRSPEARCAARPTDTDHETTRRRH